MTLAASEKLLYSTVRIETTDKDGRIGWGTGFFMNIKHSADGRTHVPILVTNKHVIAGAKSGKFFLTQQDAHGIPLDKLHFEVNFEADFESQWKFHPDSDVDLCALPVAWIIRNAEALNKKLFYIPLDISLIPTSKQVEEMFALEEIVMIGYPNAIWDIVNNKPILRRGTTATHPKFDYQGKKEIMIDAACFPGSSGSPVLIFNEGAYKDKNGNLYSGNRIYLLGVLYSGPQFSTEGTLEIVNVPTGIKPVSRSLIPMNLGVIIKSEKIIDFEKIIT